MISDGLASRVNAALHARRCDGEEEEWTQISACKRGFFYVQKEPAPKSFYSAIFYWNQAEDEPCLQPPRRTHGRLGAPLLGGAEHGGPQQPTAGWKTSVSATH